MRSSQLAFVYLIFLAKSYLIVFASFTDQENSQYDIGNGASEIDTIYAENDVILANLLSLTKSSQTRFLLNQSGGKSSKKSRNIRPHNIYNLHMRESLSKLFRIQDQKAIFDLRNFEIKGWPKGVDRLKGLWTL